MGRDFLLDIMIKSVPDTDDKYFATSGGEIYRLEPNGLYKPIKIWVNEHGYCTVTINSKKKKVHRVVAQTFLENPDNFSQVNHKDGNKRNNCIDNLEWCSHLQNMNHARQHTLVRGSRSHRPVISEKDDVKTFYPTIAACSRAIGADSKSIRDILNGRYRKTCKGFMVYEPKSAQQTNI